MSTQSIDLVSAVVDQLDEGVWILDVLDATIRSVNRAAHELVGLTDRHLTGRDFGQLLEPRLPVEGWQLLIGQIPAHGSHRLTVSIRGVGDLIVPAELSMSRSQVDGRDVVVAITRDRAERVRLEEHLRTQRELLDSTIAALGEGVAVVDRSGRIENANATFARLLDLSMDRILNHSVFDPPWIAADELGAVVPVEATPPVITLRTGLAARSEVHAITGNGLERPFESTVWLRVSSEPLRDATGELDGAVITLADLTDARNTEQRLRRLADTDPLTGLRSRVRITSILSDAVAHARGNEGGPDSRDPELVDLTDAAVQQRVGVLHLDLDNFRTINQTFGSHLGDQVLAAVADRLRDLQQRHVEIGRLGVDEFALVIEGAGASLEFDARLRRLADEVQRRTEQPLTVDGLELRLTASVGIARWPGDADTDTALLQAADHALTAGRHDGRHQLRFYSRAKDDVSRTGMTLDRDLRLACAQRDLDVYYQPILDLRTGQVAAAEALVRWNHPEHGPIAPSVFIPTAETTGAISAVSDLVVSTVAEDLAAWNLESLLPAGARIAVNISATEFAQRGFVDRLASILDNSQISPRQLELEITETLLMNDLDTTANRLTALDDLGFLVALDDFGTGYSSLSYLHTLPLHTLKVDRCFVGDLRDGRSETITRSILSLAQGLGIGTVGEGVETEEQRRFLLDAGCDLVQGFYFAPPLPRPAFERFLREHRAGDEAVVELNDLAGRSAV